MKPGGFSFRKARRDLELAGWSDRTGRESGAGHRSGSPRGDRSQGQTGTSRVFGGDGFRYQYPNGDQVEYTVVLFECSKEGSVEQSDNKETQHLAYFAPEAPPPLGLAYPASIFLASSISIYFEQAKG
jgi:hypothetical protein